MDCRDILVGNGQNTGGFWRLEILTKIWEDRFDEVSKNDAFRVCGCNGFIVVDNAQRGHGWWTKSHAKAIAGPAMPK